MPSVFAWHGVEGSKPPPSVRESLRIKLVGLAGVYLQLARSRWFPGGGGKPVVLRTGGNEALYSVRICCAMASNRAGKFFSLLAT
jgi:hypothetical protein